MSGDTRFSNRFCLFCFRLPFTCALLYCETILAALENDIFSGTDKHYSNFMYDTVESIPFISLEGRKRHNGRVSLFTPQDTFLGKLSRH